MRGGEGETLHPLPPQATSSGDGRARNRGGLAVRSPLIEAPQAIPATGGLVNYEEITAVRVGGQVVLVAEGVVRF